MRVEVLAPSLLDAEQLEVDESKTMSFKPVFYSARESVSGPAIRVTSDEGKLLCQVQLMVSGAGQITSRNRTARVTPEADANPEATK